MFAYQLYIITATDLVMQALRHFDKCITTLARLSIPLVKLTYYFILSFYDCTSCMQHFLDELMPLYLFVANELHTNVKSIA